MAAPRTHEPGVGQPPGPRRASATGTRSPSRGRAAPAAAARGATPPARPTPAGTVARVSTASRGRQRVVRQSSRWKGRTTLVRVRGRASRRRPGPDGSGSGDRHEPRKGLAPARRQPPPGSGPARAVCPTLGAGQRRQPAAVLHQVVEWTRRSPSDRARSRRAPRSMPAAAGVAQAVVRPGGEPVEEHQASVPSSAGGGRRRRSAGEVGQVTPRSRRLIPIKSMESVTLRPDPVASSLNRIPINY